MIIENFSAFVRSFRVPILALGMALLCAAPLSRSARADATPSADHIYLYDDLFGFTDVTDTFDGESVVSVTGDVVYVTFGVLHPDGTVTAAISAGQHTTDIAISAGQHTTDISAGQHTTDILIDDETFEIVGFAAP